jgi:enhancing lycopene biosynthesis protein 2
MATFALLLSGCGVFDGSEIHESVLVLLALSRAGHHVQCLAPDVVAHHVTNHVSQDVEEGVSRQVLLESARIARGEIKAVDKVSVNDFDAAIYPGGFGAATTLCDFGHKGADCVVLPEVLQFAQAMAQAGKPQGFLCIAPVLISKIYGSGVLQTIGNDSDTASKIAAMGGEHRNCLVHEVVVDENHKVVSSPAYMLAQSIVEVEQSVNALVAGIEAFL